MTGTKRSRPAPVHHPWYHARITCTTNGYRALFQQDKESKARNCPLVPTVSSMPVYTRTTKQRDNFSHSARHTGLHYCISPNQSTFNPMACHSHWRRYFVQKRPSVELLTVSFPTQPPPQTATKNDRRGAWKETVVTNWTSRSGISVHRPRKPTKMSVTIVSRSPRQDMSPGYSEAGVLRHPV